ncbi:anthranilate synthase component I family protein [Candidatus Laterigemmans baculatus]|uniref:anthranilate synthase component I family protein n=1 Tax=Candidatus Laterigemmans baculatus TaxID=2770505 RepID=UPI0013DB9758|nr:anthranilate synthase component I family protein [Candidatus Laterigemmans baculatus]
MNPTVVPPSLAGYQRSAREVLPLVHPLPASFTLAEAFDRLQSLPGVLWFDSVTHPSPTLGRYSFLTADPVARLTQSHVTGPGDRAPFEALRQLVASLPSTFDPALPPFQGGVAGLFGYEWGRQFESIPETRYHDLPTPALSVGLYDWTLATDHRTGQSWIISQGFEAPEPGEAGSRRAEADSEQRFQRAARRIDQVLQWLAAPAWPRLSATRQRPSLPPVDQLAPQFPTQRHPKLTSNFSPEGFREAVAEIVRSIRRGDCFQVNLAQRLLFPAQHPPGELYRRLRRENSAPEAGYYDGGTFQVLSSSPETFLRVRDRRVETRPIKGTCRRSGDVQIDAELAAELSASEKDRAENVMIVDLMRNDLSRVCTDQSVRVEQLCRVEPYAYVQHLVSVVTGELRPEADVCDLLAACFPGGSITGAPKVEAMRTIAALERVPRGPYCGSLGYISCGGAADFNILIRTITQTAGYLQIPVGGGITAVSDPSSEERETWHKAEGLLRALPI